MLEIILEGHVLYVLMGVLAAFGCVSKLIVNISLKGLVQASGNMNKSTHPLVRLVRAKFEHTCMISDKVTNVRVFVDKYLYEYKTMGLKLHSWRRMEKAAAGGCLLLGMTGALLEYSANGMGQEVLKTGALGAGLAIFVYLVHLTTDENYRLEAVHNYMVDYLENICMHKYEKVYAKEIYPRAAEEEAPEEVLKRDAKKAAEKMTENVTQEDGFTEADLVAEPQTRPELEPQPQPRPELEPQQQPRPELEPVQVEEMPVNKPEVEVQKKPLKDSRSKEPLPREVLIRQILEEFMA